MDFVAELQAMAAALQAEGVEASLDPSDLNLPGVFLTLDSLRDLTLAGDHGTCRVRLYLLVADRDPLSAASELQQLYAATAAVVPPMSDVEATLNRLPSSPAELPALTYTHDA